MGVISGYCANIRARADHSVCRLTVYYDLVSGAQGWVGMGGLAGLPDRGARVRT